MTCPTRSSDAPAPAAHARRRALVRAARSESGFTLAGLIVILTVMAIIVAYTVPAQWSMIMQREREKQTIFLMKQYARGIREFQLKHKSYPVSLDQLRESKDPRYLRNGGKWPCPLTGREEDWILVPPTQGGGRPGRNPASGGGTGGNRDRSNDRYRQNPGSGQSGNPTDSTQPGDLNPNASPDDYVGQFVGVRPKAKGKSLLSLNGAEDYSEWVYTVTDLENEITVRNMELAVQ